jgi:hypothetical protein
VFEIQQDLEPALDDAVGLTPLQIDHEADAAAVVLVSRVVEALRGRSFFEFHG